MKKLSQDASKNNKWIITVRKWIILVLFYAIVQILIMTNVINDYIFSTLVTVCINVILAVSLNLITGFTGQFSLGHAGFMSIGAYTCALITLRYPTVWGFLGGLLLGAVLAAIVGIFVGLPTLRLKGDYLAIATLGMAEIIKIFFRNVLEDLTNGAAGLSGIPQFVNWTWLFVFTAGTVALISNFINSSHGRACISVREDEIAAEAMGINSTKYKVIAFVTGAFFAGIAGAIYSSYFYFISPDMFDFQKSIDILVVVVLGGMGSISGSVIASIVLALISTLLQSFSEVRMVIYGVLLIVIMLFRPQGIMGSKELSFSVVKKWAQGLRQKNGGIA
ncbi:high-affinity branched-chain amino acid ABC transporter system permease protein LivM [Thermoclostridium stercorarium subsp. stercorarium DSM 8532]|jgi:branched-chain amino acid transport system permease protein|uniref:High-affinity branched-chain amino acid ABC transporter system permease protein LivM n=3 Tax=Thermoclostridium stercorarium TaxID=1510 RepID=L7VMW2_THES1|nr:branched-chain amino acid ABC transporter permease [Thermoclostridium stercorarium]AGC67999.1 high-affinity branched-chain amino acid ABC transporter system permease protein LivM [Thermoclostridium stercorarium subsp. stercorarium DSM 8532]AGI39034.1 ABC transporter periplasmic subunit [Thermoclostridium stercorarium subsp. stercorarium DSM 8532]ANW98400.1 ABC transporter [Thermoclostridium stercorarium subsp. thermolacticum DSM 2910]ANX00936.1 ABC transporter [Thermoclostridium stercorarium